MVSRPRDHFSGNSLRFSEETSNGHDPVLFTHGKYFLQVSQRVGVVSRNIALHSNKQEKYR